eukprot:2218402-Rhodomonas_salina.1
MPSVAAASSRGRWNRLAKEPKSNRTDKGERRSATRVESDTRAPCAVDVCDGPVPCATASFDSSSCNTSEFTNTTAASSPFIPHVCARLFGHGARRRCCSPGWVNRSPTPFVYTAADALSMQEGHGITAP